MNGENKCNGPISTGVAAEERIGLTQIHAELARAKREILERIAEIETAIQIIARELARLNERNDDY